MLRPAPTPRRSPVLIRAIGILALPSLAGCSSLLTLADATDPAVYRGTTLNAHILHDSVDCQPRNGDDFSCAYPEVLWPLALLDFIPSLVLDTALLPVTGLQSLLHEEEKHESIDELIEDIRQYPPLEPAPASPPHSA